jgi:hypothetical protein
MSSIPPHVRLRDAIEQIVGSDIGHYKIGSNEVSAIVVTPPEPRNTWKPVGLEVVVCRKPELADTGMLRGARRSYRWIVFLNQWSRDDLDTLTAVRDRILDNFPGTANTYQPLTAETNERANLYIPLQRYVRRF